MVEKLIPMDGDELVRKLLDGERSFRGIVIPDGYNMKDHEGYGEVLAYLRSADLEQNPVNIEGSRLYGLRAHKLFLPYICATGASLGDAKLYEAVLSGSKLDKTKSAGIRLAGAHLDGVDFSGADLENTVFSEANLEKADLNRANLQASWLEDSHVDGANFEGAWLVGANMVNVSGLDTSKNLGSAKFSGNTLVTRKEKAIIEKLLGRPVHLRVVRYSTEE